MDSNVRRRLSFIYLLQTGGSFIFLFLIVAVVLQLHWRNLGDSNAAVAQHKKYQWVSSAIFFIVAGGLFFIKHELSQLLLAYGLMFFNLARAAYGSYKLRKLQEPEKSSQNLSLRT